MASSDSLLDALHVVSNNITSYRDIKEILDLTRLYFSDPTSFREAVVSSEHADHKNRNHLIRSVRNGNVIWAKKVIQLLDTQAPIDLRTEDFVGKECYVCYESFEENNVVYKVPCRGKHIFHKECICKWVSYNSSCPYCRDPITIEDISTFLNRSSESEKGVLYYAIKEGDLDFVKDLVAKGAKVQYNDASPLHLAAGFRHKEMVKHFLEEGVEVDTTDRYGHTPLWYAASFGDKSVIEPLLLKGGNPKLNYFNEEMDYGERTTILHLSIHRRCMHTLKWLVDYFLSHNLSLDESNSNNQTPLSRAIQDGFVEFVYYLLEKGVQLGGEINPKNHPLYYAIQEPQSKSIGIFDLILEAMDTLYLQSEEKEAYLTFLYDIVKLAFKTDISYVVKLLKNYNIQITKDLYPYLAKLTEKQHIDIGKIDTYLFDPAFFFVCVKGNHYASLRLLFEQKKDFDVNVRDASGNTAVHMTSNQIMWDFLEKNGLDFNAVNAKGQSVLHSLFFSYDLSGSDIVFSKPPSEETSSDTKLHTLPPRISKPSQFELVTGQGQGQGHFPRLRSVTLRRRDQPIPPIVVDEDEEVDEGEDHEPIPTPRRYGTTYVKKVVTKKVVSTKISQSIHHLLEKKVNVSLKDSLGLTALDLAFAKKDIASLSYLMSIGEKIESSSSISLYKLAYDIPGVERNEILTDLLTRDIPIDMDANILMHYAIRNAYHKVIDKLVAKGVSCNVRDEEGVSALFGLVQNFQTSAYEDINVMKEKGYDLDVNFPLHLGTEQYDWCPPYALQLISHKGSLDMIKCLVKHGADINIQDSKGWTPLHYAYYADNTPTIEYLLEKGCDATIKDKEGHEALYYKNKKGEETKEAEDDEEIELEVMPVGDVTHDEAADFISEHFDPPNGTYRSIQVFVARIEGILQVVNTVLGNEN